MENNIKLVEELKSGNSSRTTFFKNEVIKQLKKFNKDTNEETVDYYFNLAIDSYDESVKIPFIFHISAVIKKSINGKEEKNTGNINSADYKILELYFYKRNGKYLSTVEIADEVSLTPSKVSDIIDAYLEDKKRIKTVIPDFKECLIERKKYFDHKKQLISNEQVVLIAEFCGGFGDALSIDELSIKYDMQYAETKNKLIRAFNLLTINSNLEMLLERYSNIKEMIIKNAKKLNVPILIDIDQKNTSPILTRRAIFNKYDIALLDLINLEANKALTKNKIESSLFPELIDYVDRRNRFIGKINNNSAFYTSEIDVLYPSLDIKNYLSQPRLTTQEFSVLAVLCDENNKNLNDEEIVSEAKLKNVSSLIGTKRKIYKKLSTSEYLKERVMLIFDNLDLELLAPLKEERKNDDETLTDEDIKILTLLNDNSELRNRDIAFLGGYKSDSNFTNKKHILFKKIERSQRLSKIVKKDYPNIYLKRGNNKANIDDINRKLLTLLNLHKDSPLTDEEMAAELKLANENSYKKIKNLLFSKLRIEENLKRWALTIYPELTLEPQVSGKSISFVGEEIFFLQEFCLVKENSLIYQSTREIADKLMMPYDDASNIRRNVTTKVVDNLIVGNDLNLVLWNNFLDEFITRDSCEMKKSIFVSSDELEMFRSTSIKSKLLMGVKNLENSIFADYVNKCNDIEKLVLALRLGYFNQHFFSSYEISKIFKINELEIISLTKDCLHSSKEQYLERNIRNKINFISPLSLPPRIPTS